MNKLCKEKMVLKPWQGMTIYQAVKYWKKELELTNKQFSSICDLDPTLIGLIEEKNGGIQQEYILKMFEAFKILENGWYAAYLAAMLDEKEVSVSERVAKVNLKEFLLILKEMPDQGKEVIESIAFKNDHIMNDRNVPFLTNEEICTSLDILYSSLKTLAGMSISESVKYCLVALELTHEEFGLLCGLDTDIIKSIVNEKINLEEEQVLKIQEAITKLESYIEAELAEDSFTKNRTL